MNYWGEHLPDIHLVNREISHHGSSDAKSKRKIRPGRPAILQAASEPLNSREGLMFKYWRITLEAILVFSLVLSCSKSTRNPSRSGDTEPPIDVSPKENWEAELMALCLSGELTAPDSLYYRILNDLEAIRADFGDVFEPVHGIGFRPPWMASYLLVAFDESAAQLIVDGEYHAWDELNENHHVTEIKIGGHGLVSLVFDGRLNPHRLAEQYQVLPGALYAEPNFWIGDGPNVYARQTDFGFSYLFRYARGDCPAGCIHNEYWYFVCEESGPTFIGHWVHRHQPEPEWWQEARLNREHYCDP